MSQIGISGLNMAKTSLETAGHNIANAETGGFKKFRVILSDSYSQTGGSHVQMAGVSVDGQEQMFSQGMLKSTGNSYDMALSGNGFFVLSDASGGQKFSRAGYFHLDKTGRLVDQHGDRVQGLFGGRPGDLRVGSSFIDGAQTSKAVVTVNLDNSVSYLADPGGANRSWESLLSVYDSLGFRHDLFLGFTKKPAPPQTEAVGEQSDVADLWEMQVDFKGKKLLESPATLSFNPDDGSLNEVSPDPVLLKVEGKQLGTGAKDLEIALEMTGSTQHAGGFEVTRSQQDGSSFGTLTKVTIADHGRMEAIYSNGVRKLLGQVAVANFACEQALQPVGNTHWQACQESGDPVLSTSGKGYAGEVHGAMVEQSTVDLADELLNLLVAQRNYQANARTIKAEEVMNQTLLNQQV